MVIRDVPAFALVAGNPARRIGWVGRSGRPLVDAGSGLWRCPETDETYRETDGVLHPEDSPPDLSSPIPPSGRPTP